jgi:hypothetical protein
LGQWFSPKVLIREFFAGDAFSPPFPLPSNNTSPSDLVEQPFKTTVATGVDLFAIILIFLATAIHLVSTNHRVFCLIQY